MVRWDNQDVRNERFRRFRAFQCSFRLRAHVLRETYRHSYDLTQSKYEINNFTTPQVACASVLFAGALDSQGAALFRYLTAACLLPDANSVLRCSASDFKEL